MITDPINFNNLKTGLPSIGVSGLAGREGLSNSRVFFMSLDDIYVSSLVDGIIIKEFNKNLKIGDVIYVYVTPESQTDISIFEIAYPELKKGPDGKFDTKSFFDYIEEEKVKVVSRIVLSPEILNLSYDVFKTLYIDSKDVPDSLISNYSYDKELGQLRLNTGLFGTPNTKDSNYFEKLIRTDLFNSFNKGGLLNIISLYEDKHALLLKDLSNNADLSISSNIKSISSNNIESEKSIFINADVYLTNNSVNSKFYNQLKQYTIDYNSDLNVNGDLTTRFATIDLSKISKLYNSDTVFAYTDEKGYVIRHKISDIIDITRDPNLAGYISDKGFYFWLEHLDSITNIEHTSGIYRFDIEQVKDQISGSKETFKIRKISSNFEKEITTRLDIDSRNSYITVTHDTTSAFFKAGTVDNLESLSKVNVSIEKNLNKINDLNNSVVVFGKLLNIKEKYGDNLITDGFNNSQIKAVKVIRNDDNLFSFEIYISYSELSNGYPPASNIKDFYEKRSNSGKQLNDPLIIEPIDLQLVVFGSQFSYMIPGYHDFILDTNYEIAPKISSFPDIQKLNELNTKYGTPNSLIVPFKISLTALDVERLKSNNVTKFTTELVLNDFYENSITDEENQKAPTYKPILRDPSNLMPATLKDINKFRYTQNILCGVIDSDKLELLKTSDNRLTLLKAGDLLLDTIDEPVIRAQHNRDKTIFESVKKPLTYSFDIDITGINASNAIYEKTIFVYIKQDNPEPAVVHMYPHISNIKYFVGDNELFNKPFYRVNTITDSETKISTTKFECVSLSTDNSDYYIYPIAFTALYKKQEDKNDYINMRIDNTTRRVVGPEDKLLFSVYPLYDNLLEHELKKSEFPSSFNLLNIQSTSPVAKIVYNKYPLLPENSTNVETVEYNKKKYPSIKYSQYNQNAPIFYGINIDYEIFDKDLFKVKTDWDNEYNFLSDNNLLTDQNKDTNFDFKYRKTDSNKLLALSSQEDHKQFSDKISLTQIKDALNKNLLSNGKFEFLAGEISEENPYYKSDNSIPEHLFRAPLWDFEWSIPVKSSEYENSLTASILDLSNYSDYFTMNIRVLESNYPNRINVLALRCPTIEIDTLDNKPLYINSETLKDDDWNESFIKYGSKHNIALTDYIKHYLKPGSIKRYFNYYIDNTISRDTKNTLSDKELDLYNKNIHKDIEGILFDSFKKES